MQNSVEKASTIDARALHETKGTALLAMKRSMYAQPGRAPEFAHHVDRASRDVLCSTVAADDPSRNRAYVTSNDSSY